MSNQQSFTPQVQDSDSQSDSEHFDEESKDHLPSNSREKQSEDDSELLMMVLINLPIIKFTCQHHVSGFVCHV